MGSSVADVTNSLGPKGMHRLAESTVDPRELLWGILHTLSQIRGSPSYLFPTLLERCKTVLGLDCTITTGNWLPGLGQASPDDLATWTAERSSWYLAAANHDDIQNISEVESDGARADMPAIRPDMSSKMRFQNDVY